jgi:ribosomal protein S18 acetylase RimI-like enzyme
MNIRTYRAGDRERLIALWRTVFPDDGAHNAPGPVLEAKLQVDDMIYLAVEGEALLGAIMAGYDGHRGWLYSVAVDPAARRRGVGSALVRHALARLAARGCVKVNLQVRSSNRQVVAFYEALGFAAEERISMGRLLGAPGE